ncbi:MAG: hypothetical protein AB7S57_04030, partial [Acetobacteraceae bacterium]
ASPLAGPGRIAPDESGMPWAGHAADHVVQAAFRRDGRLRGALAATRVPVGGETVLHLDRMDMREGPGAAALTRRMLALLLLRLAGLDAMPAAIAAPARDVTLCRILRSLAASCDGVRRYPDPANAVVPMRTAGLTLQTARALRLPLYRSDGTGAALLVLDLRDVREAALVAHARRLHRARLPNMLPSAAVIPFPVPRTAAAVPTP